MNSREDDTTTSESGGAAIVRRCRTILADRRSGGALSVLTLLALLIAWSATPSQSLAQGVRLDVKAVWAIQVIAGAPLVIGKPTVVRVDVQASVATQATVEVTLGASSKSSGARLVKGSNSVYVPVDAPGGAGTLDLSAKVIAASGAAGGPISAQVEVVALQRDHISALFMPVDWTAQERSRSFDRYFGSFTTATGDFMRASYPYAPDNVHLNTTNNVFMLTPAQRAIGDAQGNIDWGALNDMYSSIVIAGQQIDPSADLVIGVLPPKWFANNLHDPQTVGLEFHAVRGAVAVQADSDYATLAHETGHVFGRSDDYDFGSRPLKIGNQVDEPGYWVNKGQPINPASSLYSFMGASDAKSQYWVDSDTYVTILRMLQDGFDPSQ